MSVCVCVCARVCLFTRESNLKALGAVPRLRVLTEVSECLAAKRQVF